MGFYCGAKVKDIYQVWRIKMYYFHKKTVQHYYKTIIQKNRIKG